MSHTSESYSVCLAIWWPGPCCWDGKLTSSGSGALVPIFWSFNLLALPLICLDWDTSCSSGSSCLCFLFVCASQLSGCRPDGVLVMPIEGRGRHLDLKKIPTRDRDIPTHKVHQLATKLHCHAIKSLNNITNTRHKIHLNNNSDNGGSDGGVTSRATGFRRARRRPECMADNPPDLY